MEKGGFGKNPLLKKQRPGATDQNTKRAGAGTERCELVQRRNLYL